MAVLEQRSGIQPLRFRKTLAIILQVAAHIGSALPLLWLFYAVNAGLMGGDPVKELIHFLGIGALRLLLLTLLVSPLAQWRSTGKLNRLRRPLGLWCFTWASLHFTSWLALDLAFDWSLIGGELIERSYILLGFMAWILLLALALTSIPKLMRLMGKHWKRLHGFAYVVLLLGCWHFWWSVKSGWMEPALYLAAALFLLLLRRRKVAHWLGSFTPAPSRPR